MWLKRLLPSVLGVVVAALLFSGIYLNEPRPEPELRAFAATPEMQMKTATVPDVAATGIVWLGSLSIALVVFGFTKLMLRRKLS